MSAASADSQVRLLVLGAHPDDAEFHAGGLISLYRQLGHVVKLVAVTDGGAGHHRLSREDLVQVRRREAAAAGRVVGADYETWDHPDGRLLPTLEVREQLIREIRTFRPDLVLTHRTCDYHPDHRAVGQAVQDASYLVTVPLVCPETPFLSRDPVVAYMPDAFTRPYPLRPDVVIDIEPQIDRVVQMLACHQSQVFDFLPFNRGEREPIPAADPERLEWLKRWYLRRIAPRAARYREQAARFYGVEEAARLRYVEAYEVSEYAAPLDESARTRLFPFLSGPS